MRFPRQPDRQRTYALVEDDDGVRHRLDGGDGGLAGPQLPHDLRQLIVERELGITDGVWAGVAAGVVFGNVRTELLADLVEAVAALDHPSAAQIQRLAAVKLAVLPDTRVDPAAIAAAATAMQVEASRWARLRVGEELSYSWPPEPKRPGAGGGDAAWFVRPE